MLPIDAANTLDGGIQRMVMDGLVGFTPEYKVIWLLATGYEPNAEATEYKFFLREGVSFTDGTPWNAEAAKANIDVMLDQERGFKKNTNYKMIESVEIIDDYTINIKLNRPFGALLNSMAHPSALMVSPKQIAEDFDSISKMPIGTGQYTFVDWKPGEMWKVALNRDWWGYKPELYGGTAFVPGNAGFNTVTFKPITEGATRVAMMLSGEADIMMGVTAKYKDSLVSQGLNFEAKPSLTVNYLYLNVQKEPLNDLKVRQALAHAIDRDAMIQVVDMGNGTKADSFITPGVTFYAPQPELYPYDVEKAKALLAEAGYPDGFTIKCVVTNSSDAINRAEFMQQQLAKINVTMEVIPTETGTISSSISGYKGDPKDTTWDVYSRGFSPSTGDADQGLGRFASTEAPPVGSNYGFFKNEDYDKAVAEGGSTADPEKRAAAYGKAQEIIWQQVPDIPLTFAVNMIVFSTEISNVTYLADGQIYLREGVFTAK